MFSPKLFVTFVFSTFRDDRTDSALSSESTISVFAAFLVVRQTERRERTEKIFRLRILELELIDNDQIAFAKPFRKAERRAPRRIFFGIWYDQSRGCGPWTLPPPFHSGERSDAIRARPVPFCFQSLRPEPETFPRVFVAEVPCRPLPGNSSPPRGSATSFSSTPNTASDS